MKLTAENSKGEKMKYRLARSMKECMKTMSVDNITVGMLILEQFQRFAVAEIQRLGTGHLADGPGRAVVGHQMAARRVGQPRHRRKHRPGGDL